MKISDNIIEYIEIQSVDEYIRRINELRDYSANMLFRGQKNQTWKIEPSVFRNGYLEKESELIEESIRQCYNEFPENMSNFDKLTKLQHYGQATRLIDVTTNPLVALYFATEDSGEVEEQECTKEDDSINLDDEVKPLGSNGVIFITNNDIKRLDSLEVRVAILLSFLNLGKDINTLGSLLNIIEEKIQINADEKEYLLKDNYTNFIKLIQSNYYVLAPHSNNRLIFQSGGFLIPTSVKVTSVNGEFRIWKAQQTFEHEFENVVFYITKDYKNIIRNELDSLNINESTLFPELEHKLAYIYQNTKVLDNTKILFEEFVNNVILEDYGVGNDEIIIENLNTVINKTNNENSRQFTIYNDDELGFLSDAYPDADLKKLDDIINEYIYLDGWFKWDTKRARLNKDLKRELKNYMDYDDSVLLASRIIDRLIELTY